MPFPIGIWKRERHEHLFVQAFVFAHIIPDDGDAALDPVLVSQTLENALLGMDRQALRAE
ncbi:MAG: hypothetical protein P8Y36_07805 [Alphaproteobacteria bacterium]